MVAVLQYVTEDPWPLLFVLAFAELVLIAAMKIEGQGVLLKLALAVPVAALALVLVEWAIVTDREALEADVRAAARAVKNKDAEAFLAHFSPDYDHGGLTVESLGPLARRFIRDLKLQQTLFTFHDIKVLPTGEGNVVFTVAATGELGGMSFGLNRSKWRLIYRRGADGRWRVYKVNPIAIDGVRRVTSLADMLGLRF